MRLKKLCKCGIVGFSVAIALALVACSDSGTKVAAGSQTGAAEALSIATDAYVYGYSLITNEVTRVQMSNFPAITKDQCRWGSSQMPYATPGDYRGVSAPNADTVLASLA